MNKTVLGIFADQEDAQDAIESLRDNGFSAKDISIVMRNREEGEEFANDTGTSVAGGAAAGATTGAALGGLAGLLVGLGTVAIPGIGGILIGGPLAVALGLTGTAATTVSGAVTGALAGGLLGALMGLGIPESDARIYEEHIREGGILVAVPTTSDAVSDVKDILSENGADQVRSISHPNMSDDVQEYSDIDVQSGYNPHLQPSYSHTHMGAKGGKVKRRKARN